MNKIVLNIIFFLLSQTLLAQISVDHLKELLTSKQYSELELKLINQLKFSPNDSLMLELLGDVYGYQDQWDKASKCYQKLVDDHPKNAHYHYKYGGVLGRMAKEGSKFKALSLIRKTKVLFDKAEALDPNHIPVQWAQVQLYAELPGFLGGSYTTSWAHAERLETLSKIDGYLAKLFILEHQNKMNLAIQYAKTIVLNHHEIPCLRLVKSVTATCENFDNSLYFGVGHAYFLSQSDLNTAEFFLKQYLLNFTSRDRTPKEEAHLELATIYLEKNQKQMALDQLNKALAIDSEFDKALQIKKKILDQNIQN